MSMQQPSSRHTSQEVADSAQRCIDSFEDPLLEKVTLRVLADEVERGKWDWIVPVAVESPSVTVRSYELHALLQRVQEAVAAQIGEPVFVQIAY